MMPFFKYGNFRIDKATVIEDTVLGENFYRSSRLLSKPNK